MTFSEIKSVCVTGGAGFIGTEIVKKLLECGKEVIVIDNLSVGRKENVPENATFLEGDILDRAFIGVASECDAIIHLAARVAIRSSFDFIVEDSTTNVVGTASVLKAISENPARKVKKFLFASSMAVYSDSTEDMCISENHSVRPASPYGVSKMAGEMMVQQVCNELGIDAGVLRLFNTYGTGQALSPYVGVVTIFSDAMRSGKAPTIFGDGEQLRDFVHVEDVAQGFVKALGLKTGGQIYNIGSGVGLTVNAVYKRLAALHNFVAPAVHAELVPGEMKYSVADISKAMDDLGYRPTHNFHDSISTVIAEV